MVIQALKKGGVALALGYRPIQRTFRIYKKNGTIFIPDDYADEFRHIIDGLVANGTITVVQESASVVAGGGTTPVGTLTFSCTATEQVGDLVYVSDANSVEQADASDISSSDVIGHIVSKPTATTCLVSNSQGPVTSVGLNAGERVWLSDGTPGGVETDPPNSPSVAVEVGVAISDTEFIFTGAKVTP